MRDGNRGRRKDENDEGGWESDTRTAAFGDLKLAAIFEAWSRGEGGVVEWKKKRKERRRRI